MACFTVAKSSLVFAETLRVFPGQYVITQSARVAHFRENFSESTHRTIRQLGGRSSLIEKGSPSASAFRTTATAEYDSSDTFCETLLSSGKADSCSPNYEIRSLATIQTDSDPLLSEQWGFNRVGGAAVWSKLQTAETSIVAVVDSGIDFTHPDLQGVAWENEKEVAGNGIDDDANGYVDDRLGIDVATRQSDPMDAFGHGTHIAGIIGALPENQLGIRGLVPNVKIVAVKIFDDRGAGSLAGALEALEYVEQLRLRGVPIRAVNASWGGSGPSQALKETIERLGALGVIVAAAAGNQNNNNDQNPEYPASFSSPTLLSVAALNESGKRSNFSNFGSSTVDIAAPGEGVVSTISGGRYAYYSGTSMAAPFVTGAVALLAAQNPNLSATDIVSLITNGARKSAALSEEVLSGGELSLPQLLGVSADEPRCEGNECSPSSVTVHRLFFGERLKGKLQKLRKVSPGSSIEVALRGVGSGEVPVRLAVDGHVCGTAMTVNIGEGKGKLSLNTSRNLGFFARLSVESMGQVSSVPVKKSRIQTMRSGRSIGVRSICRSLIRSGK
jgi:hypothetical protein